MNVLHGAESINAEIMSSKDPALACLLAQHVRFANDSGDPDMALLTVLMVEQGDTLQTIDSEMNGSFLANAFADQRYGEPEFKPCFETLEEYPTFYEMLFVQSDEGHGLVVLIPKGPGIDPEILALCAQHAEPAT